MKNHYEKKIKKLKKKAGHKMVYARKPRAR
jgi:hypothetical protein